LAKALGTRVPPPLDRNPIKHEKGDPLDFLTTPSTPLKIIWPIPQGPPGFPTTVYL